MKKKTLADVNNEHFALIMSAHDTACDRIASPDYVPVLPPQKIKRLASSFMHGE